MVPCGGELLPKMKKSFGHRKKNKEDVREVGGDAARRMGMLSGSGAYFPSRKWKKMAAAVADSGEPIRLPGGVIRGGRRGEMRRRSRASYRRAQRGDWGLDLLAIMASKFRPKLARGQAGR